jgi:hypothetical protein
MANRDVEVFDNVFEGNGTSNIMITGYRYGPAPEGYNPLPVRIRAMDNVHGRTGFQPGLPGGAEMASAFGGSLPPVLWDGAGSAIHINDAVAALSLGLPDLSQPRDAAMPMPVDLNTPADWPRLPAIVMPAAMEAAANLP